MGDNEVLDPEAADMAAGGATHQIGRIPLRLSGRDAILPAIEAELSQLELPGQQTDPRLTYRFGHHPDLSESIKVGPLHLIDHGYSTTHNRIRYTAHGSDDRLDLHLTSALTTWKHRLIPARLAQIQDRAHLDPIENASKAFLYNVFDYTTQLAGLPLGQSWLHASAMCRDDVGLALIAWGGVGKTSTMLDLVLRNGWRYLSDDLALLTDDGTIYRSPKHLQIYGYNLVGDTVLREQLLRGRFPIDRMSWVARERLLGPDRVRRRVPASWLFDEAEPVMSAPLGHAIFLRSSTGTELTLRPVDRAWVAQRSAMILIEELKPFMSLSVAASSMMDHPLLLSPERFVALTSQVIHDGLAGAQTLLLDVPPGTAPAHMSRVVLDAVAG